MTSESAELVASLAEEFDALPHDANALDVALPVLQDVFSARSAAYLASYGLQTWQLDYVRTCGLSRPQAFEQKMRCFIPRAPSRFARYSLLRPARRDRNTVVSASSIFQKAAPEQIPIYREVFVGSELHGMDQLRVVVCEEGVPLAVVAVYRLDRFTAREQRAFARLIPTLRRRLALERLLGERCAVASALDVALEAVARPALVIGPGGRIQHANSAARAWFERDRAGLERELANASAGRRSILDTTRLKEAGAGTTYLAIRSRTPGNADARVASAALRWGLSPRQTRVLELVARGKANKSIAMELGCAENTVEYHVTTLLACAGVATRAGLVARLWAV